MKISEYLPMNKAQLQEELNKIAAKIKKLREEEKLLRRLQESAKDDKSAIPGTYKPENIENNESEIIESEY